MMQTMLAYFRGALILFVALIPPTIHFIDKTGF